MFDRFSTSIDRTNCWGCQSSLLRELVAEMVLVGKEGGRLMSHRFPRIRRGAARRRRRGDFLRSRKFRCIYTV